MNEKLNPTIDSTDYITSTLDAKYARKGSDGDVAHIVTRLRHAGRNSEADIVVGLYHTAKPWDDKSVAAYLFGKVWEGGTTGKVARWTNVINALRAAVIGDRNEEEGAKRLAEAAQ